jgi:hypothetical protein
MRVRTPNSVLFLFRLGKGFFSQDFLISFCGIINYNFGLSAFIFSISGVKIFQFSSLRPMLSSSEVGSKYEKQILRY